MTRLTELITAHPAPFHTYEFFPPRTEAGFINLLDRVRRLASPPLPPPLAVSVTWGAGGTTADKSLELAEEIVKLGLDVVLHLTCTNMPKEKVDEALSKCRSLGIHNVLALRGDPPRPEEYSVPTEAPLPDFFQHADDLVRYIRQTHGDYFCVGVAGYPTPHVDSADQADDLRWLKVKCDAGADFILTQLFYDVEGFEEWVGAVRASGITLPIIPGIMPIQNFASFRRLVKLTQCPVPDSIMADLEPIRTNDAAVKQYGAQLATRMVTRLIASKLVPGVHFCTLNLEKSVRTILESLDWASSPTTTTTTNGRSSPLLRHNKLIIEDEDDTSTPTAAGSGLAIPTQKKRTSSMTGLSISPSEASQLAQWGLTNRALPPAPKKGLGTQGASAIAEKGKAEDSWDEYPNGRFTDVRSPAYGEIDGWGSGLKTTANQALAEWGTPTSAVDLSNLFCAYLNSLPAAPTTPFCDLPLSPESQTILPHLIALNSPTKQYWTVGSQPAVDAAYSDDPIHGWGPKGGYVFQKAFVEFFVPSKEVTRLEERLKKDGAEVVSMYAANKTGDFRTNTLPDAVNAVTWGVFPGQEIVQSTIIEQESFLAWKEEAFEIWADWARLYPRESSSRRLLEQVGEDWWLVSLIHHDYKDKEGLWGFLLAE